MKYLLICSLITPIVFVILYIWGKTLLTVIKAKTYFSDCILFGFVLIHIVFQLFYFPFLLARGSFYILSIIWLIVFFITSFLMIIYLHKKKSTIESHIIPIRNIIVFAVAVIVVGFLCIYIGGRPRDSGVDSIQYIHQMNKMVYHGTLWNEGDELEIHQGLNSFYTLFAILSWITGIKPIYMNHFTMRFIGVIICSIVAYRYGRIAFGEKAGVYPLIVSFMVPLAMIVWDTPYALGTFFSSRTNESKAFCQILLFPLAVSIFWEILKENQDRKILWIEEIVVGLSAVPIASSSLTIYPVIVFAGAMAVIVYDRFKGFCKTVLLSCACVLPNILYLVFYVLYQNKIFRF